MRSINRSFFVAVAVSLLVVGSAAQARPSAQNWDQWRGPNRDGVGDASALPAELPAELTQAWRLTVGEGYSGPLVIDDTVYLFSREDGREILRALALADGSEIWKQSYAAPFDVESAARSHGPGPKSTPVYADGRIFTLGISGVLSAVNGADGTVIWRHDFAGDFPRQRLVFLSHFDQTGQIANRIDCRAHRFNQRTQRFEFADNLLSPLLVVPEPGNSHLGFDLGDLSDFAVVVKDCLAGSQSAAESIRLGL